MVLAYLFLSNKFWVRCSTLMLRWCEIFAKMSATSWFTSDIWLSTTIIVGSRPSNTSSFSCGRPSSKWMRITVKYRLMLAIVIPYSTRHRFYLLSHIVDKPQDTCSFPTTSRSCDYCSERMTQWQHTQSIDQRLWFLHFRIPRFMMSYHMTHFISCPRNFLLFRSGSFIRNSTLFWGSATIRAV